LKTNWRIIWNTTKAILGPVRCNYLVLFVTAHCNARCRMCFYGEHIEHAHEHSELTLEEIKKISKSMGPIVQLVASGGEPFLRNDLASILQQFYDHNGVSVITIPTNGSNPKQITQTTEEICSRLPNAIIRINISLDGWENLHDKIRRVKGLFNRALMTARNIKQLKKRFPQLSLSSYTTLSTWNAAEITDILDKINSSIQPDTQMCGWPRGELWDKEAGHVSIEQYHHAVQHIRQSEEDFNKLRYPFKRIGRSMGRFIYETVEQTLKEKRMILPCKAGLRSLVIDERGMVFPCETLQHFLNQNKQNGSSQLKEAGLGCLKDYAYNMPALLNSHQAKRVLKFINERRCHCTYECAMSSSILFEKRQLAKLVMQKIGAISKNIF